MPSPHATPPRGLDATRSPLFQGRFGRMFRNLQPAEFGATDDANNANLAALGRAMVAGVDPPTDGKDPEESGIPALYTYFGQFVDHDITFDPTTTLTKFNDPDGLTDFRNPALNLDNVYGRGPNDQPYMYDGPMLFQLGDALTGSNHPATDLPRFKSRALIGDPRNDENSIVSQLQGLFLRFHNRMVADNSQLSFEDVQQLVRFHYQYVVVHDFLPRIVIGAVLDDLKTNGHFDQRKLRFFHWRHNPFMPVEFSVAVYRLGHSMVRPGYRLNDDDANLLPIFPTTPGGPGLTGFQTMVAGRAIDWGRFIDIDIRAYDGNDAVKKKRLQFAYRIDASLVGPLATLPAVIASDPSSLAERNLKRGWRLGLPSGQVVARAMALTPLADADIKIAKAVDTPDPADGPVLSILDAVNAQGGDGSIFAGNCPLWTYILSEAAHHRRKIKIPVTGNVEINTPQLGPVGGRILAEVFLGLLFGDSTSYLSLDPLWRPITGAQFALKDLVRSALGDGPALHYR